MAAEGYLICAVYTANARLPIPGALVTILKRDPGSASQLLAIRLTDSSGRTAPVAIETPGAASTTSPGTPDGWTAVDITADHPDYQRITVENAQVFPGTMTLQGLALLPLSTDSDRWDAPEVFQTPPQNL